MRNKILNVIIELIRRKWNFIVCLAIGDDDMYINEINSHVEKFLTSKCHLKSPSKINLYLNIQLLF